MRSFSGCIRLGSIEFVSGSLRVETTQAARLKLLPEFYFWAIWVEILARRWAKVFSILPFWQPWSFPLPFGEWHSRMVQESLHVCHSPSIPILIPIPSQFLGGGWGSITRVTIFPPKNKKRNRWSEIEWRSRQPARNRREHGDSHCWSLRRTWAYLPIRVVCQYLMWGLLPNSRASFCRLSSIRN